MKKDINLICIYDNTKEDIEKKIIHIYEKVAIENLTLNDK